MQASVPVHDNQLYVTINHYFSYIIYEIDDYDIKGFALQV